MRKLLKDYTIIDWSSHLPGPYACHLLAKMGARVIKFIPNDKKMPFQKFSQEGPLALFESWYQEFNKYKELKNFDENLLSKANGIITNKDYNFPDNLFVTKIKASINDDIPRHDLNVLAESGFLAYHVELFGKENQTLSPPSLPWAGVMLSHHIVNTHLAQYLANERQAVISLKECFEGIKDELLPNTLGVQQFLHSGAYPCYRLYKLKSGQWVALAAIEKKYWDEFLKYYDLDPDLDRLDSSDKVTKILTDFFASIDNIDETITINFCLNKTKA